MVKSRCSICGRTQKTGEKGFHRIQGSDHEAALRIHIKHDTERGPSPRPNKACPTCYNSVVEAEVKGAHVVALPSTIPGAGRGVFAHQHLAHGTVADKYTGALVDKNTLKKMPMPKTHAATLRGMNTLVVDGLLGRKMYAPDGYTGLGSLVNRPPKGTKPNCRFVKTAQEIAIDIRIGSGLKAHREGVPPGRELLMRYGTQYKMPRGAIKATDPPYDPTKPPPRRKGRPPNKPPPSQLHPFYRNVIKPESNPATRGARRTKPTAAAVMEAERAADDDADGMDDEDLSYSAEDSMNLDDDEAS